MQNSNRESLVKAWIPKLLRAICISDTTIERHFSDLVAKQDHSAAIDWVIREGIGPMCLARLEGLSAAAKGRLQIDQFSAIAESKVHAENLKLVGQHLFENEIEAVVMKGAALALTVYGNPAWRTMSDIDFWIQAADMPKIMQRLEASGYRRAGHDDRPLALQEMAGGEIQYFRPEWQMGMVELHFHSLAGWWLNRTAAFDHDGLWSRKRPLAPMKSLPDHTLYQLSAEDFIIQLGVHLGLNHRFSVSAVRGLIDICLVIQSEDIDWELIVERSCKWRVATIMYLVFDLYDQLIGVSVPTFVLDSLQPPPIRRRLLRRWVTARRVVSGVDFRDGLQRFLLWILLVDRPRDMLRLVWLSVWPEASWLEARYNQPRSNLYHLWQIVRFGRF